MSEPETVPARSSAPGGMGATRERVFLALLIVAIAPSIVGLAGVWSTVDYLSHGFLVPVVSLWLWMRERPRRERHPIAPEAIGVVGVGVSLLMMAAGVLASVIWLQGIGVVAAIASTVWWFRGRAWFGASLFPLGFLVFMVPPPNSWTTPLIVRLQVWVSVVAADILNALGEPVQREGNVMILPGGGALFVAEACSGVTSVITLAPLGVLLGYLGLRSVWARLALALSVIPLAMISNLLRVLGTAFLADRYGMEAAVEGPGHTALGITTYVVAVVSMLGVEAVLRRMERKRA